MAKQTKKSGRRKKKGASASHTRKFLAAYRAMHNEASDDESQ